MDWRDKLKSLFPDSDLRGRIKLQLLLQPDGIREDIFDDDDDVVKSCLLALLQRADFAGEISFLESGLESVSNSGVCYSVG